MASKFKEFPVPENIPSLCPNRVNDGVFKALSAPCKKLNGDLHLVETALCKSMNAQALALEKLVDLKAKLSKDLGAQVNEVFTLMANSVEFNCLARARTNEVRRAQILNGLNANYKHLAVETKPENGLLFGSNLEASMRSVEVSNRLSQKLSARPHPFLGHQRGRGQPRRRGFAPRGGYQPYPRPQPNAQPYQPFLRQGQDRMAQGQPQRLVNEAGKSMKG